MAIGGFTNRKTVVKHDTRWRRKTHVYDGFPHYHHETGHCMCLLEMCCNDNRPDRGEGCICNGCPCHYGHPHGEKYDQEIQHDSSRQIA